VAVYTLGIHADYACRRSGACCTAGWRIPIERSCEERLAPVGLSEERPARSAGAVERDGPIAVLRLADNGTCVFLDRDVNRTPRCRIHHVLGHDALPSACRHFPRLAVTDDHGTFITLSHFCPTAASMLFREDADLSIREAPASFHSVSSYEGLDARGVLPPLLAPRMLMDVDAHHEWEQHMIDVLGDPAHSPETALEQLAGDAEHVRTWRPGRETLLERIGRLRDMFRVIPSRNAHGSMVVCEKAAEMWQLVRSCVPLDTPSAAFPDRFVEVHTALVAPSWAEYDRPIKTYLASRAFASWVPWHGHGIRTTVAAVGAACSVLRVEAARQCGAAGKALDRALLLEAIRQADLLLMHQASSRVLAERLGVLETGASGTGRANRTGG